MRFAVSVLPPKRPSGPGAPNGAPVEPLAKLVVPAQLDQTFSDVWEECLKRYKSSNYGATRLPLGIYPDKITDYLGADIFLHDIVGNLYREDQPLPELQLQLHLKHVGRDDTMAPTSGLRPAGFKPPTLDELSAEERQEIERCREEEGRYGRPLDELSQEMPVASREGDALAGAFASRVRGAAPRFDANAVKTPLMANVRNGRQQQQLRPFFDSRPHKRQRTTEDATDDTSNQQGRSKRRKHQDNRVKSHGAVDLLSSGRPLRSQKAPTSAQRPPNNDSPGAHDNFARQDRSNERDVDDPFQENDVAEEEFNDDELLDHVLPIDRQNPQANHSSSQPVLQDFNRAEAPSSYRSSQDAICTSQDSNFISTGASKLRKSRKRLTRLGPWAFHEEYTLLTSLSMPSPSVRELLPGRSDSAIRNKRRLLKMKYPGGPTEFPWRPDGSSATPATKRTRSNLASSQLATRAPSASLSQPDASMSDDNPAEQTAKDEYDDEEAEDEHGSPALLPPKDVSPDQQSEVDDGFATPAAVSPRFAEEDAELTGAQPGNPLADASPSLDKVSSVEQSSEDELAPSPLVVAPRREQDEAPSTPGQTKVRTQSLLEESSDEDSSSDDSSEEDSSEEESSVENSMRDQPSPASVTDGAAVLERSASIEAKAPNGLVHSSAEHEVDAGDMPLEADMSPEEASLADEDLSLNNNIVKVEPPDEDDADAADGGSEVSEDATSPSENGVANTPVALKASPESVRDARSAHSQQSPDSAAKSPASQKKRISPSTQLIRELSDEAPSDKLRGQPSPGSSRLSSGKLRPINAYDTITSQKRRSSSRLQRESSKDVPEEQAIAPPQAHLRTSSDTPTHSGPGQAPSLHARGKPTNARLRPQQSSRTGTDNENRIVAQSVTREPKQKQPPPFKPNDYAPFTAGRAMLPEEVDEMETWLLDILSEKSKAPARGEHLVHYTKEQYIASATVYLLKHPESSRTLEQVAADEKLGHGFMNVGDDPEEHSRLMAEKKRRMRERRAAKGLPPLPKRKPGRDRKDVPLADEEGVERVIRDDDGSSVAAFSDQTSGKMWSDGEESERAQSLEANSHSGGGAVIGEVEDEEAGEEFANGIEQEDEVANGIEQVEENAPPPLIDDERAPLSDELSKSIENQRPEPSPEPRGVMAPPPLDFRPNKRPNDSAGGRRSSDSHSMVSSSDAPPGTSRSARRKKARAAAHDQPSSNESAAREAVPPMPQKPKRRKAKKNGASNGAAINGTGTQTQLSSSNVAAAAADDFGGFGAFNAPSPKPVKNQNKAVKTLGFFPFDSDAESITTRD